MKIANSPASKGSKIAGPELAGEPVAHAASDAAADKACAPLRACPACGGPLALRWYEAEPRLWRAVAACDACDAAYPAVALPPAGALVPAFAVRPMEGAVLGDAGEAQVVVLPHGHLCLPDGAVTHASPCCGVPMADDGEAGICTACGRAEAYADLPNGWRVPAYLIDGSAG